jgi:hypothetical protein
MSNRSLRKKNPLRGKAFKQLRSLENGGLETITLRNGAEMIINPMKHFLLQKEYVNPELQHHLLRKIGKYALGEEKYAQLEKQAAEVQKHRAEVSAGVQVETNE